MNKDEIDTVRGNAAQAIAVLAPLVATLQEAFMVLSSMSSVEKHRLVLADEVARLQEQVAPLEAQISETQQRVDKVAQEASAAIAAAQAKTRERQAKAAALANAAEKRAEDRIIAADQKVMETTSAFAQQVQQAQQDHEKAMAQLFTQEQAKTDAIDTLEARLTAAKEQARQFAATLTG